MADTLTLMLAGAALGAMFFGGLWWTVRKGLSSQRPALWFSGSLLLRMSTVLAGLYLVGRRDWVRLLPCLCGFLLARVATAWLTRPPRECPSRPAREASHAP